MGEIRFDLTHLTLADLEQELGPATCNDCLGDLTDLKWMLSGEPAFLSASFLAFGQEIKPHHVPSTLVLNGSPMTSVCNIKFAGIRPGDSEGYVKEMFEQEERTFLLGYKRVRWDEDWVVQWLAVRGKISIVICANEGLIRRTWDEREKAQKTDRLETNLS